MLHGAAPTPDELVALTRGALDQAAAGRLRRVIEQEFALADAALGVRGYRGARDAR